jgi:hypothetical protein
MKMSLDLPFRFLALAGLGGFGGCGWTVDRSRGQVL